jgi:hypothetical protein
MKWHKQAAVGSKKELLAGLLMRGKYWEWSCGN